MLAAQGCIRHDGLPSRARHRLNLEWRRCGGRAGTSAAYGSSWCRPRQPHQRGDRGPGATAWAQPSSCTIDPIHFIFDSQREGGTSCAICDGPPPGHKPPFVPGDGCKNRSRCGCGRTKKPGNTITTGRMGFSCRTKPRFKTRRTGQPFEGARAAVLNNKGGRTVGNTGIAVRATCLRLFGGGNARR